MSTALAPVKDFADMEVSFIPYGEKAAISLKVAMVKNILTRPTKSGAQPTNADVTKFMMLCKARELNPWVGDAFLIGYDTKDGPEFNLVTAVQALFKRSEANPHFDGMEQGVIVRAKDGTIVHRDGDFYLEDDVLLGGWAKCYRKDRGRCFYDAVKLAVFNKGYGRWRDDPGGMIVKCAQSSVLRAAFPTQLGGLYIAEEIHLMGNSYENLPAMPANPMASPEAIVVPAIEEKPQTKSERLAASRPKKEKAATTTAPKQEVVETQTTIPDSAYEEPNPMDPPSTEGEGSQEVVDHVAEFATGVEFCKLYADVVKFRDTFLGPNATKSPTEDEAKQINTLAEAAMLSRQRAEKKAAVPAAAKPAPKKADFD